MPAKGRVLVTGASGFLGRRTVELLVRSGYSVRSLVRKTSNVDHLSSLGGEIYYGDVADAESLKPAFEKIDSVVHAAADTSGTLEGARLVTIQGTRNILDLCASCHVERLVYISSCAVYGVADYEAGQVVDENASLERFPERRGAYSWAKLEAEKLVAKFMTQEKTSVICLRPGTIYGPGGENYTPMIGFSFGNKIFAVIGSGRLVLPLVYVDNLVEAIFAALTSDHIAGQIYNVVDPEHVDKKCYMDVFISKLYPNAWCFYVPYNLLSVAVDLLEKMATALKRKPVLTRYRLISSQKPIFYDASKIRKDLGWLPSVSFDEAIQKMNEHHQ